MQYNNDLIPEVIQKYIQGRLSKQEEQFLVDILKTREGKDQLKRALEAESSDDMEDPAMIDPSLSASMYEKVTARLKEKSSRQETASARWENVRKIAAAVSFLVLTAAGYSLYTFKSMVTHETAFHEREVVILPDNSTVMLNAHSQLTYATSWTNRKTREVYLEGEAFFEVAEDKSKPFIVHTSDIDIAVLGTTFNVKSYKDENQIETTLLTGRVMIRQRNENGLPDAGAVALMPDQRATYLKTTQQITLKEVKADYDRSWTTGRMAFENDTFESIVKELERWYGVSIEVKDKGSLSCRFTAQIDRETLAETLDLFKSTGDMTYTIRDKVVIVEGKICNNP